MSARAMRPLAQALALQRRFVADAGHELRTPLTLLSTRAQMVQRLARTASASSAGEEVDVSRGLDDIVLDAKALTAILEDLLLAADPRRDVDRVDVDLASVVGDAVRTLHPEAEERGIGLSTAISGAAVVSGVRVSLFRVVVALVSNALDHARSAVVVTVDADDGRALLEVSDDGPGFPPGAAEHAFERFASTRPLDQSVSGRRHYGLGLALVAEVARRHGGDVELVPSPGAGAIVRVRLPLASDS
jgi:signal transduction histidine kinase